MKYRVLITGHLHPTALRILEAAEDVEVTYRPDNPYEDTLAVIGEFHAIISRSETAVTREMIDAGSGLKVIARAAVGIGNIDVDYATDKGILVINAPGKNTNSAAELTLGVLLAAVRKIVPAHINMQSGAWNRHAFMGFELSGKTIGIIGLGNVGHRVARFARAFDMEVLAHDPYIADEVFDAHQAHKVDLDTLIAKADVISLHTPQTPETTGMIGAAQFARMKDGVVLLNMARGKLVDEDALLEAIKSGKVAAAGIDTWAEEPPGRHPLADLPQVVMTPHIGASTEEAQLRVGESIADQTLRALRDEVVDFPVNMPRFKVITNPRVKFYMVLAEKLGVFANQFLEFNPRQVQVLYRGDLTSDEGVMVRRAFLKGFLKNTAEETITFVNAEKKAAERQIQVVDSEDPHFSDYASAVKFVVTDHDQSFSVGGVVFGENNYRLSHVNEFLFEVVPDGELISLINVDRPGVIGQVGTILANHGINISQFELSRNMPGGQAMSLIRIDSPAGQAMMDELKALDNIITVKRIRI
ncbi:MAG: phosphoglycerate dehydrogenase [SAR324 cluster bacterium]|nr:phosphoglycerate dehydrogenase [SAR324 cluster bacterium]